MPEQFYKEALKLGQKEKRQLISKGQYPYLPVMDEMIPGERLNSGIKLGIMQVPAEFIVGTKTEGRTNAFAANFMPLLDENSEFGIKWKRLCKAHLEEGIRDPIKVYEYMNRFYVEEGNKRVSVLKFFGAVTIPANVTRILPVKDDTPEVKLYQEFLEFYKCTKMNYIEFSRSGNYASLQKLMGKAADEEWTENEISAFRANYYYFRQLFEGMGGSGLKCTVGDAFLGYINIYGYDSFKDKSGTQIKQEIEKIWEEFELLEEEEAIELRLDPEEERKKSFLERMFGEEQKRAHVAFVYDKNPESSGWIYSHELGRQHVEKVFDGRIITKAYENAMANNPEAVIEQAVADGHEIVFTTSPKLMNASLTAAVKHPDKLFLNCSLNKPHRYIRTYYARMYEVKFIIGAIAGALTENDKVGYICDYPIVGQIAGINAFALGVQMVNPRAKVYLEWTSVQGIYVALARLRKREIDIISSMDFTKPGSGGMNSFGLFKLNEKGKVNLAMPVWHWGVYYEKLIRSILNRTMKQEYESSNKALNYYWGMSAGVVEFICSNNLPEGVKKLAELLKDTISEGVYNPFKGPFHTQQGEVIDMDGNGLDFEQIIMMDWLTENVIGVIPLFGELSEDAKATVKSAGTPIQVLEDTNEDIGNCR